MRKRLGFVGIIIEDRARSAREVNDVPSEHGELFVMKVFAARGKDMHDAETIAIRQKLDHRAVLRRAVTTT